MFARDVMTQDVLTIDQEADVGDAIRLMIEHRISGLPVVDRDGRLVGILTEGDLLRRAEVGTGDKQYGLVRRLLRGVGGSAADYVRAKSHVVADLMTYDPLAVTPGTPLEDIVELMERHRIKRVPVLSADTLVGLVSRADILREVDRRMRAEVREPGSDEAILARLHEEIDHQPWYERHCITLAVEDGVVHLSGFVDHVRVRDALVVAAQNASGRKEVVNALVYVDPAASMTIPIT